MKRKLSSRSPLFLVSLYHLMLLSLPAAASLTLGACSGDVDMGGATDAGLTDASTFTTPDAASADDGAVEGNDAAVANDATVMSDTDGGDDQEAAATGDAAIDGGDGGAILPPPANPFTVIVASATDAGIYTGPKLAAVGASSETLAVGWATSRRTSLSTAQSPNGGTTWSSGPSVAGTRLDDMAFDAQGDLYVQSTTTAGRSAPVNTVFVQTKGASSFATPANGPTDSPQPAGPVIATGDGSALIAGFDTSLIRSIGGGDWSIVTPTTARGVATVCHTNAAGPLYFLTHSADGEVQVGASSMGGAISTWGAENGDFTNNNITTECVGIGNDVFVVGASATTANTIGLSHWSSSSPQTFSDVTFANDDPAANVSTVNVDALRTDAAGKLIVVYTSFLTDGTSATRVRVSSDLGATFSSSTVLYTTGSQGGDVQVVGNVRYVTYISTNGDVVLSSWTSP